MPYDSIRMSRTLNYAMHDREVALSQNFTPQKDSTFLHNPVKKETRSLNPNLLVGSFVLGLKTSKKVTGKASESVNVEEVRDFVMSRFPGGGSMVMQLGWFNSSKEDSVRVIIEYHDTKKNYNEKKFISKFSRLVKTITEECGQEEVLYDFFQGNQRVGEALKMKWRPEKK